MIAIAGGIGFLLLLGFMIAGFMGAPWVPAFKRDVDAVIDDLKLAEQKVYVELGCGDGRLVAAAARRGAIAVGYEISPLMWLVATIRCLKYRNAKIILGDLWRADLSRANAVMIFLMPQHLGRLEQKLQKELQNGTKVVSYIYKLPQKPVAASRHHWFIYDY